MSSQITPDEGLTLGVDGGVSRLKFALRRRDGRLIYHECAGANPSLIGMEEFLARLSQGVHDALGIARAPAEEVTSAGLALSGVDRAEQCEKIERALRERILKGLRRVWVGNDAMAALRQGAGGLRGLALIAGTGSICQAVSRDGRSARVGGWGGEIGDEGSGFWIGRRAIQEVCRMIDGRAPRTGMVERVIARFGLVKPPELIPWSSHLSREEFKQAASSMFPLVLELSESGDRAAERCIQAGIAHLIRHVIAAETHLRELEKSAFCVENTRDESSVVSGIADAAHGGPLNLVCAGGLFANNPNFYEAFVRRLRAERDAFRPTRLTDPPVLGAIALGQEAKPLVAA